MIVEKIFNEVDGEEKLYSVLMNKEELALFSEFQQKEFNSKSQKALRRKYDYQQGLNHGYASELCGGITKEQLSAAQAQAKMVGEKKTNELLDYATKNTKTEGKGFFKKTAIQVKNKKEADEVKRAEDLIRAGRAGSRTEGTWPTLTNSGKENPNHIINQKRAGEFEKGTFKRIGGKFESDIEEALKNGTIAKKKKAVQDSIAHHQEIANALKKKKVKNIAKKSALGIAAVIGSGIVAKKIYDKNKKKKDKE